MKLILFICAAFFRNILTQDSGFSLLFPRRSQPQRGYHLYQHINRTDSVNDSYQCSGEIVRPDQ